MKQQKKPFRYYVILFVGSFAVLGGVTLYKYFSGGGLVLTDLWTLIAMPFIFTGIYWGGDTIMQKIADRKHKFDYEGRFLDAIGDLMRNANEFLLEDFRRLQNSQKFQETLKIAFAISKNGETETANLEKLEKKFEKRTVEYKAMLYVIPFVKTRLEEKAKLDEQKKLEEKTK
jgi:hypothetical protein